MRFIDLENHQLVFSEMEDPSVKSDEVLVKVEAIGVNHADLLQKRGKYPPPPGASEILGLEVAGTIEELGTHTKKLHKGDRVMCLLSGGGYAEKVAVFEKHCIPIPHNLSFEEAAAIPETFLTAYQALFLIGELQPDQKVLIHAGGSGVGTAAIQLAKLIESTVIITTRTQEKLEKCLEIGADVVIKAADGKFAQKVLQATDGHGVDLILDFVGDPYYDENIEALANGGAIIFLSVLGGAYHKEFDFRKLLQKWATLTGTTLRSRPDTYKTKLIEEFSRFALSRLESGRLKPIIHTVLPWEKAEDAHEILNRNGAFGKVVLNLNSSFR